jgi:hypothetical protein
MNKMLLTLIPLLLTSFSLHADPEKSGVYAVDTAMGDQELIINGTEFAAKDSCNDFQFGDQVEFLSGDPNGNCTDASLRNLRNNGTCDVWCQYPL